MAHFLLPDSDDDVVAADTTKQQRQQENQPPAAATTVAAAAAKPVRVSIEIEEEEENDEHDDQLVAEAAAEAKKREQSKAEAAAAKQQQQQQTVPTTTVRTGGAGGTGSSEHFCFTHLANRVFPMCGGDKDITSNFAKWGLAESMTALIFSYDVVVDSHTFAQSKSAQVPGQVHSGMLPDLALNLFNSDTFRQVFQCGDGRGGKVSYSPPGPVSSVTLQQLKATKTTLEMFDKLTDSHDESMMSKCGGPSILRDNGAVSHMADVFLPCGINVSDQLRGLFMLGEESECYSLYDEEERDEFLFHVMHRIVAGGAVNQYEDQFEPYKDATREVYKSFISVGRPRGSAATANAPLEVQSLCCQVKDVKCSSSTAGGSGKSVMRSVFFPKDDRTDNHNWLYLIVDPVRRTVCVWYNCFFSPF